MVAGRVLYLSTAPVHAQILIHGSGPHQRANIFNTDLAVLESGEQRKDLPCTVTPSKPTLGFDLKFHAGYQVTVPLKELAGTENALSIVFRVAPDDHRDEPVYFTQHLRVPPIEEDAKGDAYLQGAFDVGEGSYHIDWLMRDRTERVCSSYWDSEAALGSKDRPMSLAIAPEVIQRADGEEFKEEPPVQRAPIDPPLNVKVLVNFAPQNSLSAALQPLDTTALVSILRTISRDPRIGKFSIVAFNMQEQKVIYRQDGASRIDFPALGTALTTLNLGTVDLKRLGDKHGDTDFLTSLVRKEMTPAPQDHPDALVFAGPKILLDANPPGGGPQGRFGYRFPSVLHELQPESAGGTLERRHQPHRPLFPWLRIHHLPAPGFVVCRLGNGLEDRKIKERKVGCIHLKPVGVHAYNKLGCFAVVVY